MVVAVELDVLTAGDGAFHYLCLLIRFVVPFRNRNFIRVAPLALIDLLGDNQAHVHHHLVDFASPFLLLLWIVLQLLYAFTDYQLEVS